LRVVIKTPANSKLLAACRLWHYKLNLLKAERERFLFRILQLLFMADPPLTLRPSESSFYESLTIIKFSLSLLCERERHTAAPLHLTGAHLYKQLSQSLDFYQKICSTRQFEFEFREVKMFGISTEIDVGQMINVTLFWCASALAYKMLIVFSRFILRHFIDPGERDFLPLCI
jgi:hypothetical protein